jgi:2-iminobutanoate/2-iminopropanoate deaminase
MSRKAFSSDKIAKPVGPFSPAVGAGGYVFVSGQVGQDPATGRLVDGGVEAQVEQIFANLKAVLEAVGRSFADVVRVCVYLTDARDYAALNEIYARHFDRPHPARTVIIVAALPLGARAEMDAIAV